MTKPVQAVRRSVAVLMALNKFNGSPVSTIAREVALSRGTVFRMLETFVLDELVVKDPVRNVYWLTTRVQALSGGYREEGWVVEIARPALEALNRKIVWPASVQRFDAGTMHVRAATDAVSPFALWQSTVGTRVPFFDSAAGGLYLAYALPDQREAILGFVRSIEAQRVGRPALTEPRIPSDEHLELIRKRGYNVSRQEIDTTVAVPIMLDGEIFACLTSRFLNRGISERRFLDNFEALLKDTAAKIAEQLAEAGVDRHLPLAS